MKKKKINKKLELTETLNKYYFQLENIKNENNGIYIKFIKDRINAIELELSKN